MIHEEYILEFSQGTSVLHRLYRRGNRKVIFLIPGYFEDSRIFYSKSGKGLAPFLAEKGYDIFICDMVGKGKSIPKVSKTLEHSQFQLITEDIPRYINKVREITKVKNINLGGHSWGGVIAYAFLARSNDQHINSVISFGSKRRIARKNFRKWIMIDLIWNQYGNYLVRKYGFLPAKKMKMGDQDEPKNYYKQANFWVYSKQWIDPVDNFNYHKNFEKVPPSLFITGAGDKILGHPKDMKILMDEIPGSDFTHKVIGKSNNYLHDYDHINLLTHKDAPIDHFNLVFNFLEKFN